MDFTSLIILIVIIVIGWFIVRHMIKAITCGVRVLLFVIVAVIALYIVGNALGWPIVGVIDDFQ